METVSFTRMADGSRADYEFLAGHEQRHIEALPNRIIAALQAMEHSIDGYKVSRLTHSLQTATRAEADGADKEMVAAALIHDLGDDLAPENHSQLAAAIIRPYVRKEVTWVVEMHGLFQMAYHAPQLGRDGDGHKRYADHEWYESCVRFCRDWDQEAFDPDYPTKPLSHFEPLIREIFSRAPFDPAVIEGHAA